MVLALTLCPFAPVSAQVPSTEAARVAVLGGPEFMVDDVANNTTEDAYVVPGGVHYLLTHLIIATPNPEAWLSAQILGDGTARPGCIVVSAEGAVTMNFLTAIGFLSGTQVQVSNGDDAGPIHFTGRRYQFRLQ